MDLFHSELCLPKKHGREETGSGLGLHFYQAEDVAAGILPPGWEAGLLAAKDGCHHGSWPCRFETGAAEPSLELLTIE